jgi:hypothetical protein
MRPKNQNTGTLPLRFRTASGALHTAFPREEGAVRLLGAILVLLAVSYLTIVSMSIVNVIARKEATDRAVALRATVGELEREYFALSGNLTAANGDIIGLAPVSDTHYIYRPGAVGSANGVRSEL